MQNSKYSVLTLLLFFLTFPATAQNLTATQFPTFGCAVSVPNTWQVSSVVQDSDIGRWLYKDTKTGGIPVRLVVQMEPSEKDSLQKSADDIAKTANGKQSDTRFMLDGKPALRLSMGKSVAGYPQNEVIISQNGGQNYVLDFYAEVGENINPLIEDVVKNWKWLPFAAPADHLEFRKEPVSFLKDSVILQIPEIMRPTEPDADTMEKFGAYDYRNGIWSFMTIVDIVPLQDTLSFVELRDNFTTLIRDQFKLKEKITWTAQKSSLPGYLSSSFVAPDAIKSAAEKKYSMYNRYGLVKLAPGKAALLTFTLTGQTEDDRKKYDTAIRRILDSVTNGPLKK